MKKILLAGAALFLLTGCMDDTEPEVAPTDSIEESSEPMIDEPAEAPGGENAEPMIDEETAE
ncbi:MAG: hypothetical protein Q4F26_03370 [Atopococcus tabaci]|uniref:Lipoprotein n=1 Tax=Atopococcus tabaci TaxID=269774 RepID=A0AA43UCC4_9LACT|nr:hypothetical protein [Atopococcus tabaci]